METRRNDDDVLTLALAGAREAAQKLAAEWNLSDLRYSSLRHPLEVYLVDDLEILVLERTLAFLELKDKENSYIANLLGQEIMNRKANRGKSRA